MSLLNNFEVETFHTTTENNLPLTIVNTYYNEYRISTIHNGAEVALNFITRGGKSFIYDIFDGCEAAKQLAIAKIIKTCC